MATAGDRFEMPDGSTYVLVRAPADTDDGSVEMEFVLPPGCVPPPPHVHPHQVEDYEVLEGSFEVMVDGTWRSLAAGDSASVPRGVLHTFRNRSGATVRVANRHSPAVRFDEFIERVCGALRASGVTRKRDPRLLMILSQTMFQYEDTLVVPRRRDRLPMEALAAAGRLLRLPS